LSFFFNHSFSILSRPIWENKSSSSFSFFFASIAEEETSDPKTVEAFSRNSAFQLVIWFGKRVYLSASYAMVFFSLSASKTTSVLKAFVNFLLSRFIG
jgi:hypothetical protein